MLRTKYSSSKQLSTILWWINSNTRVLSTALKADVYRGHTVGPTDRYLEALRSKISSLHGYKHGYQMNQLRAPYVGIKLVVRARERVQTTCFN